MLAFSRRPPSHDDTDPVPSPWLVAALEARLKALRLIGRAATFHALFILRKARRTHEATLKTDPNEKTSSARVDMCTLPPFIRTWYKPTPKTSIIPYNYSFQDARAYRNVYSVQRCLCSFSVHVHCVFAPCTVQELACDFSLRIV